MTKLFADNPDYRAAEQLLIRLHALAADGKEGDEEAEELREDGTVLWQGLTSVERKRLQRLSAEMEMFSDGRHRAGHA